MPEFKVVPSPTGVRHEVIEIKGWQFFGDTKNWSPEVAQLVTDEIMGLCYEYERAWGMLLPETKRALLIHKILHTNIRHGDFSATQLAAARLVEFDFFDIAD